MLSTLSKLPISLAKKMRNFSTESLSIKVRAGTTISSDRDIQESKANIKGIDIHYVKVGTGEHPVLLLPGVFGTSWTDFKPQIEKLDREKLTIVAWDPPGCGESRPPERTFPDDIFQQDADYAHDLMRILGFSTFSIIGWSDGARTSMFLAATYPTSVRKMISIGGGAYILPREIETYKSLRSLDALSEGMKNPLIGVYGEEFEDMWSAFVDCRIHLYEKYKGNICKELLPKIKCPTLIVHGVKDAIVDMEHPIYLRDNIAGAKMCIFEKGAHNLHLRYPEEFNRLAMSFLVGES